MTADAAVRMVDQGVGVTRTFIAQSPSTLEVLKSATLLQSLSVNALITGARGSGKKALASYILPQAPVVNAENFEALLESLQNFKELIITQFEKIANMERFKQELERFKTRIIATTTAKLPPNYYDPFFSLTIEIPPLSERPEDVKALCQKFIEENRNLLGEVTLDFSNLECDLSDNAYSLKRSVLMYALMGTIQEKELMTILENIFLKELDEGANYRSLLYVFDVPLIKAGLKRYKSQLKLSEVLGINRNTLRKKILEYKKELEDE